MCTVSVAGSLSARAQASAYLDQGPLVDSGIKNSLNGFLTAADSVGVGTECVCSEHLSNCCGFVWFVFFVFFLCSQNEVQPFCDLGPQQEPQTALQCPLPHPQENHVLAPVQGAAAEVQRALHAHPQGRRGPGGEGTLQGPADREGGAGVQEEVRDLHRARAAREGQRHHRARGHPPQQGGDHQAKAGQGPQEDPGAQSQVPPGWQGEGQVQGGDDREDAGIAAFLIDTIKKLLKFNLLCVFFQKSCCVLLSI